MRRHECPVLREERGSLIVIARVEVGDEILSEVVNQRLNVQKRTRVRQGAGIGPIHLLPPGGRPSAAPRPHGTPLSMQRHSSAKTSVEEERIVNSKEKRLRGGNARAGGGRPREEDGFPLVRRRVRGYVARMSASGQQPEGGRTEARIETAPETEPGVGHPERFCPNCSAELQQSRCKLSCPRCGFYLSCSDFY